MGNRRRGGQPGNQTARKHGYYSNALTGEDRSNLRQAYQVVGLDDEIALLRARLKSIVQCDPDNLHLISEAASTPARLIHIGNRLRRSRASRNLCNLLIDLCNLCNRFPENLKTNIFRTFAL